MELEVPFGMWEGLNYLAVQEESNRYFAHIKPHSSYKQISFPSSFLKEKELPISYIKNMNLRVVCVISPLSCSCTVHRDFDSSHPAGFFFGGTLQFPLLLKSQGRRKAKASPCCAWKACCGSSTPCSSCTLLGSPSFYRPWVGMWYHSVLVPSLCVLAHACSLSINS